jgi:hypothetical protein
MQIICIYRSQVSAVSLITKQKITVLFLLTLDRKIVLNFSCQSRTSFTHFITAVFSFYFKEFYLHRSTVHPVYKQQVSRETALTSLQNIKKVFIAYHTTAFKLERIFFWIWSSRLAGICHVLKITSTVMKC